MSAPISSLPGNQDAAAPEPGTLPGGFRPVPVWSLLVAGGGMVLGTTLLMTIALHFEPDLWFSFERLGVKVGELRLEESQLESLVGDLSVVPGLPGTSSPSPSSTAVGSTSNTAPEGPPPHGPRFTGEIASEAATVRALRQLLEILVLAEYARELGLTDSPIFRERLEAFERNDGATGTASATAPNRGNPADLPREDLGRFIFVLEELARVAREHARANAPEPEPDRVEAAVMADLASATARPRFRLREILVDTASAADLVLERLSVGAPFAELSARYSGSLYAGVGGDLGWVDPADLPEPAPTVVAATPIGSTTVGYRDEAGIHLLRVEERVGLASETVRAIVRARLYDEAAAHAERAMLETARRRVPIILGPKARALLGGEPWPRI